jgi:hypothetical protein
MLFTELHRLKPEDNFEESELYLSSYSIYSARIDRDTREYYGQTELMTQIDESFYTYYVKETPSQISKMIEDEEQAGLGDE